MSSGAATARRSSPSRSATDRFISAMSETGRYFRNNVWWWRRLWALVPMTCGDIVTSYDAIEGSVNSGYRISSAKATKIAARLEEIFTMELVQGNEDFRLGQACVDRQRWHPSELVQSSKAPCRRARKCPCRFSHVYSASSVLCGHPEPSFARARAGRPT
jgi:hypothetical protein